VVRLSYDRYLNEFSNFVISIPKVVRLSYGEWNLELIANEISIPKVVRLSSPKESIEVLEPVYFNPKSGSIKFSKPNGIITAATVFQSQKWFD